jgi:hypothetical protein
MFDVVYENKILCHDMLHHNMDMLMLKVLTMILIISIHLKKILMHKIFQIKIYHYQRN